MKSKKRLFQVKLEDGSTSAILDQMETKLTSAVQTKLEEKKEAIKVELESAFKAKAEADKVALEAAFEEKLSAHKQEIVELTKAVSKTNEDASDVEKVQLQRLNSCLRDGSTPLKLEDLRKYHDELTLQMRSAARGEQVQLDATIAGFAGYDDAKGGALIVPEYDPNIRQDFIEYDEGLFNAVTFEPSMSRTKKVVVDTVEPDENTKATKESLKVIGYTLDDGGFVSATLNLKDYDTPARLTFDQIEDSAFRVETYVNGKLVQGSRRKVAKDLWIGNSAESIKGIINYPQGSGYGKIGVQHVATAGTVTMDDIMNLCKLNKNKGVLFIDRATWGTAITEKDKNDRYLFELGAVAKGMGAQPFNVDAVVPLLNVPVIFDDAFTEAAAVAANVRAAILPPSAIAGYKRPVGRFAVDNGLKHRDLMLTERYDAVLTQFNYVKLLLGTAAA